ncbi:prepilin-type N-terminal cleavage/methylation domain-containing protein [Pontiella sp.]|uniref:type IV pilus modification PilV family protein n=1 Tax=Pontiella sp. TaxID=2837462 RepID=UPI00356479EF
MKFTPDPSLKNGFTVLEILVALLVFAIGVAGMLATLTHHMKEVSLSEDHARGVRIAQREMNALRRLKYLPAMELTGAEGRYVWSATVEEADYDELPGIESSEVSSSRALRPCTMTVLVQWSDAEGGELRRRVRFEGMELFQRR